MILHTVYGFAASQPVTVVGEEIEVPVGVAEIIYSTF